MGAHFGFLKALESFKKHIRGSKAILLRILCEKKDALAALSGPKTPQKPHKGAQGNPKWSPKGIPNRPKTARRRHLKKQKSENRKKDDHPTRKPCF